MSLISMVIGFLPIAIKAENREAEEHREELEALKLECEALREDNRGLRRQVVERGEYIEALQRAARHNESLVNALHQELRAARRMEALQAAALPDEQLQLAREAARIRDAARNAPLGPQQWSSQARNEMLRQAPACTCVPARSDLLRHRGDRLIIDDPWAARTHGAT